MARNQRELLILYKKILRESQKFASYNFRMYAIRRTKDAFRDTTKSSDGLAAPIKEAQDILEVIKRQALISRLYSSEKLVLENGTNLPT